MSTRLGILSIILAMSIFLIFELKNFPVANADISITIIITQTIHLN